MLTKNQRQGLRIMENHTGVIINTFKVWDSPEEYPACMSGTGSLVYLEKNAEMAKVGGRCPGDQAIAHKRKEMKWVQDHLTAKHKEQKRNAEKFKGIPWGADAPEYRNSKEWMYAYMAEKTYYKHNEVTAAVFRSPKKDENPGEHGVKTDDPEHPGKGDGPPLRTPAYPIRYFGSSAEEYTVCGHGNLAIGLSVKMDDQLDAHRKTLFYGACDKVLFELEEKDLPVNQITRKPQTNDDEHPQAQFEMQMGSTSIFRSFECCVPTADKPCASCPMTAAEFEQAQKELTKRYGMRTDDWRHINRIFLSPGGGGASSGWCPESAVEIELANMDALKYIDHGRIDQAWAADVAEEKTSGGKLAKSLPAPFPQKACPGTSSCGEAEKIGPLQYRGYLAFVLERKNGDEQQFKSRCLYPQLEVTEDVATGSANALMTHPLTTHYTGIVRTNSQQMAGRDEHGTPNFTPSGQMQSRNEGNSIYVTGQVQLCYATEVKYDEKFGEDSDVKTVARANLKPHDFFAITPEAWREYDPK
jgi:predicted PhzF superfamily epimerase YddE/YHI9